MSGWIGRAMIALGATLIFSAPANAQPRQSGLTALAKLEPGLWQLRDLDQRNAAGQSICIADPNLLMQIEHRNSPCSRLVLANQPKGATVHYTCPANGFGRTSLRVETSHLAKIDTQGIIDNAPFAYRAEARRVGACTAGRVRGAR
jgi:hypothetical protein